MNKIVNYPYSVEIFSGMVWKYISNRNYEESKILRFIFYPAKYIKLKK